MGGYVLLSPHYQWVGAIYIGIFFGNGTASMAGLRLPESSSHMGNSEPSPSVSGCYLYRYIFGNGTASMAGLCLPESSSTWGIVSPHHQWVGAIYIRIDLATARHQGRIAPAWILFPHGVGILVMCSPQPQQVGGCYCGFFWQRHSIKAGSLLPDDAPDQQWVGSSSADLLYQLAY